MILYYYFNNNLQDSKEFQFQVDDNIAEDFFLLMFEQADSVKIIIQVLESTCKFNAYRFIINKKQIDVKINMDYTDQVIQRFILPAIEKKDFSYTIEMDIISIRVGENSRIDPKMYRFKMIKEEKNIMNPEKLLECFRKKDSFRLLSSAKL